MFSLSIRIDFRVRQSPGRCRAWKHLWLRYFPFPRKPWIYEYQLLDIEGEGLTTPGRNLEARWGMEAHAGVLESRFKEAAKQLQNTTSSAFQDASHPLSHTKQIYSSWQKGRVR